MRRPPFIVDFMGSGARSMRDVRVVYQGGINDLAQCYGLRGLSDLPPIHQGAFFDWGGEIDGSSIPRITMSDPYQVLIASATNSIQSSGYANDISVKIGAGLYNPYIKVQGKSGREYGSASHLQKAITDAVESAGYRVTPGSVNFYADTYTPGGGTQQVSVIGANNRPSPSASIFDAFNPDAEDPSACSISSGIPDYLACQLGISRTSAFVVGAIGGLLAIVAIKKLL